MIKKMGGVLALPLRPVWPSWMAATPPIFLIMATALAWPSIWASSQSPAQWMLVRPSGEMAICSGKMSPNPPAARAPRYIRWKSSILPSTELYIVIGDIAMRLRTVTPLRV